MRAAIAHSILNRNAAVPKTAGSNFRAHQGCSNGRQGARKAVGHAKRPCRRRAAHVRGPEGAGGSVCAPTSRRSVQQGLPCRLQKRSGRSRDPLARSPCRLWLKTFGGIPPDAIRILGSDVLEVVFAVVPEGDHRIHVFGLRYHEPVLRRLTDQRFGAPPRTRYLMPCFSSFGATTFRKLFL